MSIDIITYIDKYGQFPEYVYRCYNDKVDKGFNVLPLTPDSYDCKPCHAGYKHFRDITMSKLKETKEKGLFICEGDVIIDDDYNVNNIDTPDYPVWYGYKKKRSTYIIGNFLLWLPKSYYNILQEEIEKKKGNLLYSDRFFTQLVKKDIIKLHSKSIANEIQHYSNVIQDIRKSKIK
jgi:hypothetical protein